MVELLLSVRLYESQVLAMRDASSHRIRSISVTGGFLDGAKFDLAPGLNCLIGARGTGKTTLVELVRWSMGDLADRSETERRRIESLVESNLDEGRAQVEIETKDKLRYIVSRIAGEEPVVLTADSKPTNITLKFGGVFKADIYSQNEIESIADRAGSQLTLIDNFAADEIAEIEGQIRKVKSALAANANHILPLKEQAEALKEEISTLPNVEEELKGLSEGDSGSAKEIDKAHQEKALRESERQALESMERELKRQIAGVDELGGYVIQGADFAFSNDILRGPNGQLLAELRTQLIANGKEIERHLKGVKDQASKALAHLATARSELGRRLARNC